MSVSFTSTEVIGSDARQCFVDINQVHWWSLKNKLNKNKFKKHFFIHLRCQHDWFTGRQLQGNQDKPVIFLYSVLWQCFSFPEENFHPSLKPHFHSSYRPQQVKLIKAKMRGRQTSDEQESENHFSCWVVLNKVSHICRLVRILRKKTTFIQLMQVIQRAALTERTHKKVCNMDTVWVHKEQIQAEV